MNNIQANGVDNLVDSVIYDPEIVRINGTNSKIFNIICNLNNTCKIDCQSHHACTKLYLYCFGLCLVQCDAKNGINCPPNYRGYTKWTSQTINTTITITTTKSTITTTTKVEPTADSTTNRTIIPSDTIPQTTEYSSSAVGFLNSTQNMSSFVTTPLTTVHNGTHTYPSLSNLGPNSTFAPSSQNKTSTLFATIDPSAIDNVNTTGTTEVMPVVDEPEDTKQSNLINGNTLVVCVTIIIVVLLILSFICGYKIFAVKRQRIRINSDANHDTERQQLRLELMELKKAHHELKKFVSVSALSIPPDNVPKHDVELGRMQAHGKVENEDRNVGANNGAAGEDNVNDANDAESVSDEASNSMYQNNDTPNKLQQLQDTKNDDGKHITNNNNH